MHTLFSKLIFGKSFGLVDKVIDSPAWTPVPHYDANGNFVISPLGPNHRDMFHTPLEAAFIGLIMNPENPIEGITAGLFHVAFDTLFDGVHSLANKSVKRKKKYYKSKRSKKVRK